MAIGELPHFHYQWKNALLNCWFMGNEPVILMVSYVSGEWCALLNCWSMEMCHHYTDDNGYAPFYIGAQ